jgi:hypothetical protein
VDREWKRRERALALAACCVLVAVPFLSVDLAPITDLPQHLAQIRLFHETLADPHGPYRIQWLTPYLLAYLPLSIAWLLSPGVAAGRAAMLILALLWVLAIHGLAYRRGRAAAAAILASVLFFNHGTYWGFYSFAIGWPAFVLWFLLTTRADGDRFRPSDALLYLGAAALLYVSHALWLAAGTAWFLLRTAVARPPRRITALRLLSFSPVLVMAAVWYAHMTGFTSPTRWTTTPTSRLSFAWIIDAAFGGLHGPAEPVLVSVLAVWVGLGLYQNRERLAACVDRDLCLAAALFTALALALPSVYQNTVTFAERWLPAAVITLLLGVPAPAWPRALRTAATLAVVAVFIVVTRLEWIRFEREELAGLRESLAALPANPRVIGLDYVKLSPTIKGRPFLQDFAYAQVVRGGQLNFSFAEFAPMGVVYKTPRTSRQWTHGLEWLPETVTREDFAHFDHALLNGEDWQHASVSKWAGLAPLTGQGRWRLYRVDAIPR